MASEPKDSPGLLWQGVDLPRVPSGDYQAACIGWQGPEWCKAFHRWSLRLEFSLLEDGTTISAFFNLGNNADGPHIGARSRFYRAWSMANGESPRNGQKMGFDTFTSPGLLYTVRVEDAAKNGKDELKPNALIYSRATEILKVARA